MTEDVGLRERKKQQTRRTIARTAVAMFAERGFDSVTVADIAAAADVSAKTVFNYFPTKEDLVLFGREEVEGDFLSAVEDRPPGETILSAVRRQTLAVAERARGVPPERVAAFRKVLQNTPTVQARWLEMLRMREQALARALAVEAGADEGDMLPTVIAGLLGVVHRLAFCNITGWPDDRRRSAAQVTEEIERAFALLEHGVASYGSGSLRAVR